MLSNSARIFTLVSILTSHLTPQIGKVGEVALSKEGRVAQMKRYTHCPYCGVNVRSRRLEYHLQHSHWWTHAWRLAIFHPDRDQGREAWHSW